VSYFLVISRHIYIYIIYIGAGAGSSVWGAGHPDAADEQTNHSPLAGPNPNNERRSRVFRIIIVNSGIVSTLTLL